MHEEELVEVNKKLKTLQEDNQTLEDKREALERDMSIAEDEMINFKRDLAEITKEKKDLEKNHEQLKKELEEQGLLSIGYNCTLHCELVGLHRGIFVYRFYLPSFNRTRNQH